MVVRYLDDGRRVGSLLSWAGIRGLALTYVTIRDVAERAGVSPTTVSQILHGKGRFSRKTRDFVLSMVKSMGYVPDSRARAMRSDPVKTVGLLVPDLRNAYFADMVASMEEELYARGISTLIGSFGEDSARQDSFLRNIMGQRIDGAIVVPKGVPTHGIEDVVRWGLPLVFVDRRVPGLTSVPYIVSDPSQGIRQALQALFRKGHRRVGFVSHSSLASTTLYERESAFRELTAEMMPDCDCPVVDCEGEYDSRVAGLDVLMAHHVTAVIFGYSPDAITMIGLMQKRQLVIGADISVVSFDDIEVFRLMTPQVSVISQQAQEMGRRGVREVLELIGAREDAADDDGKVASPQEANDNRERHMVAIPTIFIARDSIGPMHRN